MQELRPNTGPTEEQRKQDRERGAKVGGGEGGRAGGQGGRGLSCVRRTASPSRLSFQRHFFWTEAHLTRHAPTAPPAPSVLQGPTEHLQRQSRIHSHISLCTPGRCGQRGRGHGAGHSWHPEVAGRPAGWQGAWAGSKLKAQARENGSHRGEGE